MGSSKNFKQLDTKQPMEKKKPIQHPKVAKSTVTKKQHFNHNLRKWFMMGVASSAIFKVFKTNKSEKLNNWYYKLVSIPSHETKEVKYLLVSDINKEFKIEEADKYSEVKSIIELEDCNVKIELVNGEYMLAEICISKKFIKQALFNYTEPAILKRKK